MDVIATVFGGTGIGSGLLTGLFLQFSLHLFFDGLQECLKLSGKPLILMQQDDGPLTFSDQSSSQGSDLMQRC